MRDKFTAICKKSFSKLNSWGNYSFILKDEEHEVELLALDYFCILIYINKEKEVFIRIFESEFKEYFYSNKELRKNKLEKIILQHE